MQVDIEKLRPNATRTNQVVKKQRVRSEPTEHESNMVGYGHDNNKQRINMTNAIPTSVIRILHACNVDPVWLIRQSLEDNGVTARSHDINVNFGYRRFTVTLSDETLDSFRREISNNADTLGDWLQDHARQRARRELQRLEELL